MLRPSATGTLAGGLQNRLRVRSGAHADRRHPARGPALRSGGGTRALLESGGSSMRRAAFENSFFLDPEVVRKRMPYDTGYARISRTHYPGKNPREKATWNGCEVMLGRNNQAQYARSKYSGRVICRVRETDGA